MRWQNQTVETLKQKLKLSGVQNRIKPCSMMQENNTVGYHTDPVETIVGRIRDGIVGTGRVWVMLPLGASTAVSFVKSNGDFCMERLLFSLCCPLFKSAEPFFRRIDSLAVRFFAFHMIEPIYTK